MIASKDELDDNVSKYMILIIEWIQQDIIHYKELEELKTANDSNAVEKFDRFMNTFENDRNAINRIIVSSSTSKDDEPDDLIEIDDYENEIKYNKKKNDADMREMSNNEYDEKNSENSENNKIIMISN